jgi:hypothetical protein
MFTAEQLREAVDYLIDTGIDCLVAAPSKLQRPSGDRVKTVRPDAEMKAAEDGSFPQRGHPVPQ